MTSETVTRDDIEAKLREIRGEADATGEQARGYTVVAGVVAAVAVVGVAYLWGRRRGKKRTTFVEIKRV